MSAPDTLNRLRNVMSRGMTSEEFSELNTIENRIKKLEDYQTLAGRPAIREFLDWCLREVSLVKTKLSTDRDLHKDRREAERLAMIDRKDILLYFVGLFNTQADLDAIDQDLADRVKTFEDYQAGR